MRPLTRTFALSIGENGPNSKRENRAALDRAGPARSFQDFFAAVALPPLRPAAFFCAVVPPWLELLFELEECDFLPPRLEAPGELAIFAARSLDIPLSFSASYCFSFLTLALLLGMRTS